MFSENLETSMNQFNHAAFRIKYFKKFRSTKEQTWNMK